MEEFVDILEARRRDFSTLAYFLRGCTWAHTNKQNGPTHADTHKISVLHSRKIQELIERVSVENGAAKEEVAKRVQELLEEIGYKRNFGVIKTLGLVLTKILVRSCKGIFVNERTLLQIKESMGHTPVALVPTHRSYADFILMSYLFYLYQIAIPTTAAGMDFQGMMGMGEALRKTGAFFMRRTFGTDKIYGTVFRQYVHQLVTRNDDPLQFFVEGTRSRTGKSLPPKFGLILMTLKPFFTAEVPDIWFLPLNTNYDRVLEEQLYAFEQLGVPKPKETTSGLIKSMKIVNDNYGNVYINFGQPISVREWFQGKIVRKDHNLKPLHEQELTVEEKKIVVKFAYDVVYKQQQLTVITTFNLIALCLTNSIIQNVALKFDALLQEIAYFKTILEAQGATTDVFNLKKNVLDSLDVHKNLVKLNADGEISLYFEEIVLGDFNKKLLKGYNLSEKTMTKAVPFVMLQMYVNPIMHFVLHPTLLALAVNCGNNNTWCRDGLQAHYIFFRSLFTSEFVVFDEIKDWEFDEAVEQSKNLKVLSETEAYVFSKGENEKLIEVLCNLLDPFLECYSAVCNVLLQGADKHWTEKEVFVETQAVLEKKINNESIFVHPNVLSLDTIKNCFSSLNNEMRAVNRTTLNQSLVYKVHKENLTVVTLRLSEFVRGQKFSTSIQLQHKL